MRPYPHDAQPGPQLNVNVKLRAVGAAKRWVVALMLSVVLSPIDVHGARFLEARHSVGHQVVKPQVEHLQAREYSCPRRGLPNF